MPKISRAAGPSRAVQAGVESGSAPPVLLRGERIVIADGAIGFAPEPGARPDLWVTRAENGTLSSATGAGAQVLLIDTAGDLPPGTPAGVVVVVKS